MSKALSFLLTMAMLLYNGEYLKWQGTGNFSHDNITEVWTYINSKFQASWQYATVTSSSDTKLVDFAVGLSDNLNSLWDPAWNVVVVYISDQSDGDSVLYGYAFRDHWMWYNGYKMDDNHHTSFIIWKDYNCIKWFTHNYNTADRTTNNFPGTFDTSASNAFQTIILNTYSTLDQSEVWKAAQKYSDLFTSDSGVKGVLGSDTAFSIIMSQRITSYYFGKFCAKNYFADYYLVGTIPNGISWGVALILQMR